MSDYTSMNRASSYFFFAGFVLSKLQRIPVVLLSLVSNTLSLVMYLVGYSLWFIATLINPEKREHAPKWYGFAELKQQSGISAFLGIIATTLSLIAIHFPLLILPASWLFVCSNIIWTISEFHQLKNPPQSDPAYSHSYQETYLSYAVTMTISSILGALSVSIGILYPPIAVPVLIVSLILSLGLGALALEYWLSCSIGNHKPSTFNLSYEQMSHALGPSLESSSTNSQSPYHGIEIFDQNHIKDGKLNTETNEWTCKSAAI